MSRARLALAGLLLAVVSFVGCQGVQLSGLGVAGTVVSGFSQMVASGDFRGMFSDIDEPQEIELGRATTAAVGARYRLLRDEALTRYVALVGNSVALQSDRPDVRYYFAVLDSDDVNAFAAAGGYVFVTRGALALMRDEATLAGVLGHEIGHVALRHHAKAIKAAHTKGAFVTALQTGVAASGTRVAPFAGAFGLATDVALEATFIKGFSRAEESEADGVGFKYAARAGYDPAGLRDFLRAMQPRGGQAQSATFFSTHPGTDERLRDQDTQLRAATVTGRRSPERFEANVRRAPSR